MSKQANGAVIEIAGSGGIQAIAGIHERILIALQKGDNTVIDLEHVTDTDITLVQVIEAARRYATATGKLLALKQPANSDLQTQLERGGFLNRDVDRLFWLQTAETNQ